MSAELAIIIKATNNASRALKDAGNDVESLGTKLGKLGTMAVAGAAVAGVAALAGGLAYSVEKASEFEKAMSGIKAVTGASAEEMDQMSKLALQLGADTAFSASEAADAIGELAKGGVSVADIMGGAAKATLDLAAASGEKAAPAAALAANAMALFNKEGSETAKVADAVAGFANATTGDMNDFKFALSAVGVAAKLSGQEFDQTAVAIGLMGKAGLLGSDAGTSLKTMLLNLVPSTKAEADELAKLGLNTGEMNNAFLNADGSFKDLRDISDVLHTALDGLSEAQKTTALQTLFGNDAFRAAGILAEAGAEGWDNMSTAMLTNVTAADVATTRLDNLKGSQDQLNGSIDTVAITLGKNFTPMLKEAADWATKFTNDNVIPLANEYGPALTQSLRATGTAFGAVGSALEPIVSVVGPAVRAMFDTWGQGLDLLIAVIYKVIVAVVDLKNGIGEAFDAIGTKVHETISAVQGVIENLGPTMEAAARNLGQAIVNGIVNGLAGLKDAAGARLNSELQGALATAKASLGIQSPSKLFAEEVGEPMMAGVAEGITNGAPQVRTALDGFKKSILDLVLNTELVRKFGELGADLWGNLEEAVTTKAYGAGSKVANSLQRIVETARKAGVKEWSQLGDDLMAAMTDALTTGSEAAKAKVAELISLANQAIDAQNKIKNASGSGDNSYGGSAGGSGPGTAHTPLVLPKLGISAMASGGIVTRPTFALIGESGPEAVMPLNQAGGVHVHLEGAQIYGVQDLDTRIRKAVSEGRRMGALAK